MTTSAGDELGRALAGSLVASTVSAAAGLFWGISSGSGAILFDGLFSALSLITTGLALRREGEQPLELGRAELRVGLALVGDELRAGVAQLGHGLGERDRRRVDGVDTLFPD